LIDTFVLQGPVPGLFPNLTRTKVVGQEESECLWTNWLGVARAESFRDALPGHNLETAATWNQRLSGSLLSDISFVEVALRNLTSKVLQKRCLEKGGSGHWLISDLEELSKFGGDALLKRIGEAKTRASLAKPRSTPDDLIAELSFGFWLNFLNRRYQSIHSDLATELKGLDSRNIRQVPEIGSRVRRVRNRVAHHHRIIHRNLIADWHSILALARVMDPKLEAFIASSSLTPSLLEEFNQIAQAKS
jgi:hypothetical protein